MIKKLIHLLMFLTTSTCLYAQINNQNLTYNNAPIDTNTQKLSVEIFNSNFFKNNEYFHNIATGYTLFGTQNILNASYQPNANIQFKLGVYARKDFGNNQFTKVAPYYLLSLSNNGYTFNFGNYDANLSHRLIEPMYNREQYFTNFLENGVQFKVEKDFVWSDTWIDWQKQQYLYSDFLESIAFGHSSIWKLYENENSSLSVPLQLTVLHNGGQLDTLSKAVQFTTLNPAIGLQVNHKVNSNFMKNVGGSAYFLTFKDINNSGKFHFNKGAAFLADVNATFVKNIVAHIAYWHGDQYVNPQGGYLYQSASNNPFKMGYTEKKRNLILMTLAYQKKLFKSLNIDVRLEPYYDINNQFLEYSYSLQMTFRPQFLIKKI